MDNEILDEYEATLLATLGSITAYKLVTSKDASKTVRECSMVVDKLSVAMRKQLIEEDKKLVLTNPTKTKEI